MLIIYIAGLSTVNTSATRREIHTEVVINAPASRVWQVLIDFEAYQHWNPFIHSVSGIVKPGNRISVQMLLGNRTMTFRPTVLAVEHGKELRWLGHLFIPGIFDGEHSFVINPVGENQVLLIQSEKFNGLLVLFSGGLLETTERSFKAMNQAIKERSEHINQKK